MNNYDFIGKIVSTHGLNGELKIISDEIFLDKIFKVGNILYIGDNKKNVTISSYRLHKQYNLIILKDYEDINLVDGFIGESVFIKKNEIELLKNEYLLNDLLDCQIYDREVLGIVVGVEKGRNCNYLRVKYNKEYLIPLIKEYVLKIDCQNKKIYVKNAKSLIL